MKKVLKKKLKEANATIWQSKAAFILLKINGIENALTYINQVKKRNTLSAIALIVENERKQKKIPGF